MLFDLMNPWFVAIIGGVLATIFGGLLLYFLVKYGEYRKINKKATIQRGITLSFDHLLVNLKAGEIQEISGLTRNSAVVLPANTTFIDNCITDKNSALGAFFLRFYPRKISDAPKDMEDQLKNQGCQKDKNGSYLPGTTIVLPKEYDTPAKCIITASTIRKEKSGIRAEPNFICECIRQIFLITSAKKIDKLHMPILGSGHGGLDLNDALFFLILAIKYYSKYFHHIKSIDIIVTEKDIPKFKDIYRLQHLTLLTGRKR